jgi:cytochrome P450
LLIRGDRIIGNVYKLAFWVVAYLVHDPTLLSLIRDEVAPTVKENVIDEDRLRDNCPLLESLVSEVQRLTLSSPLGRVVTSPVVIGGKLLKPGNKMMVS